MKNSKLETKKKNLIIKLCLNKELRTLGYVYDYLEFSKDGIDEKEEIKDIKSTVEEIVKHHEESIKQTEQRRTNPDTPKIEDSESRADRTRDEDKTISAGDLDDGRFNIKSSVFNPKFPDQKAELTTQESHGCEQVKTAKLLFDNIFYNDYQGQLLIAPGGSGKTYILASVIKNLQAQGFYADCLSPWPALYISKVSIVEQTKDVLENYFNLDLHNTVHVINIEMLRGELVGSLIEEDHVIENGEEKIVYRWRKGFRPRTIFWDESQGLAREHSLQSTIANSLYDDENNLPWKTYEIDASATPGSRIMEMKHFALSSKKVIKFSYGSNWSKFNEEYLTSKENWGAIKRHIISEVDSSIKEEEYNPQVMANFINKYSDRIIWIKNIIMKHKGHLNFLPIDFESEKLRQEYSQAEEEHLKRKARLEGNEHLSEGQVTMGTLASKIIFGKAAEHCKRYFEAKWANDMWNQGFAPAIGFKFKQTASSVIRILMDDYCWKRSDISIIWGGSIEALTAKKKLAKRLKEGGSRAQELLDELGIDLSEDLGLELSDFNIKTNEQYEWEKENKLLTQKPEERESERLRYIRQDSRLALFSYKSGGVGLSLHHQKDYPKARPRRGIFTPDYSEKLGIQALYRLPRLTSVSDTYMWYVYYKTSIETEIMDNFLHKCRSLQEVTKNKEFWNQEDEEVGGINNIEIKL